MIALWREDQKILVFNRFRFVFFFSINLLMSVSPNFVGVPIPEGTLFVPVKLLVMPVMLAAMAEMFPFLFRRSEQFSSATLWYNAVYMVSLSVLWLWAVQIAVLIYGFQHWERISFSRVFLRNAALLFWAPISIGICRLVLQFPAQWRSTLSGSKSD